MKYLLFASIILLILCTLFRKKSNEERVAAFYRNTTNEHPKLDEHISMNNKIPKIIHQTAPADKSKWNPIWTQCQESWKKNFPNYEYKMWTDEDNENLVKTKYPWFYDTYKGFKHNISRVDCSRYFYLYEYGGIYADMDYECLKNFEHLLPTGKACTNQMPGHTDGMYENALMASPPKHPFWMYLLMNIYHEKDSSDILQINCRQIDKTVREHPDIFFTLEYQLFAPPYDDEFKNLTGHSQEQIDKNLNATNSQAYARHHGTGVWNK